MPHYFTYGTLQSGFQNHEAFASILGRPLGIYRTTEPFPLVVPTRPACPNPGCRFDHRIPALLDRCGMGHPVVGEVFQVSDDGLAALDRLEQAYHRREITVEAVEVVEPSDQGSPIDCQVYVISDSRPFLELVEAGAAEMVERYTLAMADGKLKRCCRDAPGHPGPHDVSNPF